MSKDENFIIAKISHFFVVSYQVYVTAGHCMDPSDGWLVDQLDSCSVGWSGWLGSALFSAFAAQNKEFLPILLSSSLLLS